MTSRTKKILKLAQNIARLPANETEPETPLLAGTSHVDPIFPEAQPEIGTDKHLVDSPPAEIDATVHTGPLSPEKQPEVGVDEHSVDPLSAEIDASLQEIDISTKQSGAPNKNPTLKIDCQPSTSRAKSPVRRQTSRTKKPRVILTDEHAWSSDESDPFADSGSSYVASDDEDNESDAEVHSDVEYENEQEDQETDLALDDDPNEPSNTTVNQETWGPCTDLPIRFQYSAQNTGIQTHDLDVSKPYKIFRQFLTDEILDIIVVETNRYALQYTSFHQLRPRALLKKWTDTNRDEIKKFIAILMIMGIVHLPKMRLYWSSTEKFGNFFVQKIMKRDRFECLLKCLHFSNNEDAAATTDRLFKIRNIIELICKQFHTTLVPGENLVIDESMVPWRGRLRFRQYLPSKSHKYGIKLYKICTPDAFTYDLRVYVGKNEVNQTPSNHGHSYDICFQLMENLLGEGRTLFIDNFYTSVQLSKDLLDKR